MPVAAILALCGALAAIAVASSGRTAASVRKVVKVDFVQAGDAIFLGGGGPAPAGSPKPGPFYSHGALYPAGTLRGGKLEPGVKPVGTGQNFGWLTSQGSIQFSSYHLKGRGALETQGGSDPSGANAIVGGTGRFQGATGEMTPIPLADASSPVAFRLTFTFKTR